MVTLLEDLFPGLRGTAFRVTSPKDPVYNCIAFAADETQHWWWPDPDAVRFWPSGIEWAETHEAFEKAFASLGYTTCETDAPEAGFEKIALFGDQHAIPTHAARQLSDGRWSSKLGELEDIEHELRALEGTEYGLVVLLMRRAFPRPSTTETVPEKE
jgi:hypothetical protein